MSSRIIQNNPTLIFIIKAIVLLMLWFGVYEGFLRPLQQPDRFLINITALAGQQFLNLFGYSLHIEAVSEGTAILMEDEALLIIAANCNGLAVFSLFAGFVLIFPRQLIQKIVFIPIGLLFLFMLNVARVVVLTLCQIYHPDWLDFNHKYTFTILIYAAVFGLWMLWVNKLAVPTITQKRLATA